MAARLNDMGVQPRKIMGEGLKQFLGARFANDVGERVSAGFASADFADVGGDHGRAMLPLEFELLVLGAHAVGDEHKTAPVFIDDDVRQFQKSLPQARAVEVG